MGCPRGRRVGDVAEVGSSRGEACGFLAGAWRSVVECGERRCCDLILNPLAPNDVFPLTFFFVFCWK